MSIKLYATPLSHFARKIRILLEEYEVQHRLIFVDDLLSSDPNDFGGNPILRIPTLVDGSAWVVESDQIACYLCRCFDPEDRFRILNLDPDQQNILSMINAAMAAEVEILLSQRSGIPDIRTFEYFRRHYKVIEHCLQWLEQTGSRLWTTAGWSYLDIALTCMWDHLSHYRTIEGLDTFHWLRERAAMFSDRPSVAGSAPANQGA